MVIEIIYGKKMVKYILRKIERKLFCEIHLQDVIGYLHTWHLVGNDQKVKEGSTVAFPIQFITNLSKMENFISPKFEKLFLDYPLRSQENKKDLRLILKDFEK